MDINFTDLEKLIKLAERSDINSLEVTDGDVRISIVCQPNGNENSSYSINNHSRVNSVASASSSEQQTAISADGNKDNTNNISASSNSIDVKAPAGDTKNRVLAPMLGSFFRRSEPTADEFVKVGDQVDEGQTLCIIEAMKMMHEVKADAACTIKEVLIDEGDIVEYGQALFIIEPNS